MTSDRLQLYRVGFKVRFKPEHPKFFEFQFGTLFIWLFDETPRMASDRAKAIVEFLPYEFVRTGESDCVASVFIRRGDKPLKPEFELAESTARQLGIAFFLASCPIGTDEGDLEDRMPPV